MYKLNKGVGSFCTLQMTHHHILVKKKPYIYPHSKSFMTVFKMKVLRGEAEVEVFMGS